MDDFIVNWFWGSGKRRDQKIVRKMFKSSQLLICISLNERTCGNYEVNTTISFSTPFLILETLFWFFSIGFRFNDNTFNLPLATVLASLLGNSLSIHLKCSIILSSSRSVWHSIKYGSNPSMDFILLDDKSR